MSRLAGDRVALSELRWEDSATLFGWINDPDVMRFNAAYTPVHQPRHEDWFRGLTADPSRIIFAIRARNDDRLLGTVQLIDIHPVHRTAELTIRIGDDGDRGRGFGSEAVHLITAFGFVHRNLQRVWLRVFGDNHRALKAYAKAGFVVEGTLRRACFIDGRWQDEVIMAALRETP